jgi:hypothetical protein
LDTCSDRIVLITCLSMDHVLLKYGSCLSWIKNASMLLILDPVICIRLFYMIIEMLAYTFFLLASNTEIRKSYNSRARPIVSDEERQKKKKEEFKTRANDQACASDIREADDRDPLDSNLNTDRLKI